MQNGNTSYALLKYVDRYNVSIIGLYQILWNCTVRSSKYRSIYDAAAFYIQLDTKQVISKTFFPANLLA